MPRRGLAVLVVAAILSGAVVAALSPVRAPPANAGGEDTEPGIRITLWNLRHAVNGTIHLAGGPDGEVLIDREVQIPGGERWEIRRAAPMGAYDLEIELEHRSSQVRSTMSSSSGFTTAHCPGTYLFRLVSRTGARLEAATGTPGCMAEPTPFEDFAASVHAIRSEGGEGAVVVPVPHDGDVGTLHQDFGLDRPDWSVRARGSGSLPFKWTGTGSFVDAGGRIVSGPVILYGESKRFHSTAGDGPGGAELEGNVSQQLRYASGRADPLAHASGLRLAGSAGYLSSTTSYLQSLQYGPPEDGLACMMRLPWQGRTLQAGQRYQAAGCLPSVPDDAVWIAGEPTTHAGFEAIPVGLVAEEDGRRTVAVAWMTSQYPYPLEFEFYQVGGDRPAVHHAYRLAQYRAGGEPIATESGTGPPLTDQTPIDPLLGPQLSEARDRFEFPLDEAARAALEDPTLTGLQSVTDDPSSVLAGAVMRYHRDAGAGPAATSSDRVVWHLVFTAPDAEPVRVDCHRPVARTPAAAVAAPQAKCREVDRTPYWARQVDYVPSVGRSTLPAEGASFDAAVSRWDALSGDPERSVPYAVYRAWDGGWRTSWEWYPQAAIVVGDHHPVRDESLSSPSTGDMHRVRVDLDDVRTLEAQIGAVDRGGALSAEPTSAPTVRYSGSAEGLAEGDLPAVAPLAAGTVGILGLLWLVFGNGKAVLVGLYHRLGGDEVLDHEVRSAILEVARSEPGIHASRIADEVDIAGGQARHHLRVLVREGVLTEVEADGYRRYFESGRYDHREMRALAALRAGQNDKAFRVIRDNPGIGVSDLASMVDVSPSYASKMVERLKEVGLVDKVRDGRRVALYADEDPDAA